MLVVGLGRVKGYAAVECLYCLGFSSFNSFVFDLFLGVGLTGYEPAHPVEDLMG